MKLTSSPGATSNGAVPAANTAGTAVAEMIAAALQQVAQALHLPLANCSCALLAEGCVTRSPAA